MNFDGQVVVVTGAARGIGFSTAMLAAQAGARTIISDLDEASVDAAVAAIRSAGGEALGVVGDVSLIADVRRNTAQVVDTFGRIDVLVNNAAVQVTCLPEQLTEGHRQRELTVGLTGAFLWSQAVAVRSMIPRSAGSIVNVGSGAALAAMPNSASYVAAEHGLAGLTKALAVDGAQHHVRVNCVCPGFTWTDLSRRVRDANPAMIDERISRIPLGRGAQPDSPARAILFLASPDAPDISGAVLPVDGATLAMSSGYSAPGKVPEARNA